MNRKDQWALAFAIYFFTAIPLWAITSWVTQNVLVFWFGLLINAAATLFIAWRRGDL